MRNTGSAAVPAPALTLALALALAGCGSGPPPAAAPALPAAYRSGDCAEVLGEYGRAMARHDWQVAALAWEGATAGSADDRATQAARLERDFASIASPVLTFEPVMVTDGPASRRCVAGLSLRGTPGAPPRIGTISLTRASASVAGATEDENRWRIDDMTVADPMERVERGDPG